MDIGFGAPVSGAWATPQNLASFATAAERAGYHSLWSFQRLLIPAGSSIEPVYRSVLDPLAKQAPTVEVLSGGRHDLGLGIGWMPEEFALTGADMARRGARAAEYVQALRTLWSDEVSAVSGEFYQV